MQKSKNKDQGKSSSGKSQPKQLFKVFQNMNMETLTNKPVGSGQFYSGRLMLVADQKRFTFIQKKPRGKRNILIRRTEHMSILVNQKGEFSGRLHFETLDKNFSRVFMTEARAIIAAAEEYQKGVHYAETK